MAERKQNSTKGRQNRIWSASSKFFHSKTCSAAARIAKKNLKSGTAPSNKVPHSCISNTDSESVEIEDVTKTAKTKTTTTNLILSSQVENQSINPVRSQSLPREPNSPRPVTHSDQNGHEIKPRAPEKQLHLNPHCLCDPCTCTPPCTCGLQKRESKTHTSWDADNHMLTHTVSDIYRPVSRNQAAVVGPSQHNPANHKQHSNTETTRVKTADEALAQLDSIISRKQHFLEKYQLEDEFSDHHNANAVSVRTANHKGYDIEIRTHYEISVDGEPLDIHIQVSPDGKVHCHSIPNYQSNSTVDLIRAIVDNFRDDFPPKS